MVRDQRSRRGGHIGAKVHSKGIIYDDLGQDMDLAPYVVLLITRATVASAKQASQGKARIELYCGRAEWVGTSSVTPDGSQTDIPHPSTWARMRRLYSIPLHMMPFTASNLRHELIRKFDLVMISTMDDEAVAARRIRCNGEPAL